MHISNHTVVTLDYTLTDAEGNVIDRSEDGTFAYLHGASNIIPGLEQALDGKSAGDALSVSIEAEDGYGTHDEDKTVVVPTNMFPEDSEVEVGMQFQAQGPEGESLMVTVTQVEGDSVTVDGNHPLAGVQLNFDVSVIGVRAATAEEIAHGHVHGPGGEH